MRLTQNTYSRSKFSLNGDWHYIVDPYETGSRNHRDWVHFAEVESLARRAYGSDLRGGQPWERIEYDFRRSPVMRVPGSWSHQVTELTYYEGSVWFQRDFDHPGVAKDRRVRLRIEAANYHAEVYLNGRYVGDHWGGFDPFEFEVTQFLKEGENSIVVHVDNRREKGRVPGMTTDWWNYGGITRDIYLFEVPATWLLDYHLQLSTREKGLLEGRVQVAGEALSGDVEISIPELSLHQSLRTNAEGQASFQLSAPELTRWSPDNPKLYSVRWKAGADEVEDRIGFRTIEVRDTRLLLNGEPLFLRGISVHEENPAVPRRNYLREDCEEIFNLAGDLHCNFLRLAHYPHNEHMPRMADERGFLLWEEIPVYWGIEFDLPEVRTAAVHQLDTLVRRDRNRASVIVWSLANETPVTASRLHLLKELKAVVRTLDKDRLVSAALDKKGDGKDRVMEVADPFAEECDVVSCNEYVGWYDGTPDLCRRLQWKIPAAKPFFVSEFGAGALAGRHGDKEDVWTEEYQAWVYERQIEMLRKLPNFCGCSPWILRDFRSPRRNLAEVQDQWNRKGLIGSDGKRKLAFSVLKEFYAEMKSRLS